MTSPHISWLKHGSHAETALVGSVVVGRVALDGDLWTWQASLPHGDLLADHGGCETERQAKEHLEDFLKLWLEPFRPLLGAIGILRGSHATNSGPGAQSFRASPSATSGAGLFKRGRSEESCASQRSYSWTQRLDSPQHDVEGDPAGVQQPTVAE